ncbi:putative uncharacterized protein [Clostridium sp. CAG:138]|nr:putative uncharacterized protein [Clostridium sp. CAG:138]
MSKYEPLWNYVMQHEPGQFSLTFDEIEDVLGFQIDHSFLKYKKRACRARSRGSPHFAEKQNGSFHAAEMRNCAYGRCGHRQRNSIVDNLLK